MPATLGVLSAVELLAPATLLASDGSVPDVVSLGVGALGLVLAAVLLVEVLMLKKFADGGAITRNMNLVVLSVLCLATAALVGWLARFLDVGFDAQQVRLAAEALVIAAMALLGLYFAGVRRAMREYVEWLTGFDHLRAAGAIDDEAEASDAADATAADDESAGGVPGA